MLINIWEEGVSAGLSLCFLLGKAILELVAKTHTCIP